jgi:hypothetical protein
MSETGESSAVPGAIGYVGSERLLGLAMNAEQASLRVVGVCLVDRAQSRNVGVQQSSVELEKSVIGAIQAKDRDRLTHLMTGPARTYAVKWVELSDKGSDRRVRIDRIGQIQATGDTSLTSALVDRVVGIAT